MLYEKGLTLFRVLEYTIVVCMEISGNSVIY